MCIALLCLKPCAWISGTVKALHREICKRDLFLCNGRKSVSNPVTNCAKSVEFVFMERHLLDDIRKGRFQMFPDKRECC